MAQVLVTEEYLEDVADAIRAKLNTGRSYTPAQMADGVRQIHGDPVLGTKNIAANGTYDAATDDLEGFSSVVVDVPNTYEVGDEGKVVSGGALVAQTSREVTANGTVDTTTNNEVSVNVPTGELTPVEISVIDNGSGSFIAGSGNLQIGRSDFPAYRNISIELALYSGCLIKIDNSGGSRNQYGLYNDNITGQSIVCFEAGQNLANSKLVFMVDDYKNIAKYLVYDYTSSSGEMPIVIGYMVDL